MSVDVTAWCVVGKMFDNEAEVVSFLENRGYKVDGLDEVDFDGYEAKWVDGYSNNSTYILGKWINSSFDPIAVARDIEKHSLDFEERFGDSAEFIVTERWW